jgi:phage baseplate assembly protein W
MNENIDFKDLYLKYKGHPLFNEDLVEEDEPLSVIVSKVEMILFTNKGDVFGDPNFGADLETYLHETKVSAEFVREAINEQIFQYAPELIQLNYQLEVTFVQEPSVFYDIMLVDFQIGDLEINAFIS